VVVEHPQPKNPNRRKTETMMKRRMKKTRKMMRMKMMSEGVLRGNRIPTRSKPVHNVTK
jgi:hypothetical protein